MKTGKEFVERYTSMFTEDKEWWANTLDEWFKPYDVTYKDERIDLQNELIKERDQEIQYQKSLITQLQSTIDEKDKAANYWKQRCEAAEFAYQKLMDWYCEKLSIKGFEESSGAYKKWQEIKDNL